jgi:hypothetical protein
MISDLPVIKMPEAITQICSLSLKNTKSCHKEIAAIIKNDSFLSLYIEQSFAEFSQKGGMSTILSSLGWEGFRNRLGEAYLYYARHGQYPKVIAIEQVKYAIEFERRFDFLFSENNGRAFILGLYLKLCEIDLENENEFSEDSFVGVPHHVDAILATGKSKSSHPDWLIITVWSFYNKFGKSRCLDLFKTSKGNLDEIINQVPKNEYGQFICDLIAYGHAINDTQFFTEQKV